MNKYEESNIVELKEKWIEDKIVNTIVAFLNTKGGTLYVGIKDNGEIIGIKNRNARDELLKKFANIVNPNNSSIKENASKFITAEFNDDNVLVIKVQKGLFRPYWSHGKVYIRLGSTTRIASPDEIKTMYLDDPNFSFKELPSKNQDLTFKYFEEIIKQNNLQIDKLYNSLWLKNKEGKYTNLAFLLSDQNDRILKLAIYDFDKNILDKQELEGSLLKIADDSVSKANLQNIKSSLIVGYQAQRIEKESFPGASLREAILNAICHANYARSSFTKIEFYPDKVEITSPGGLFENSLDSILEGFATFRNKNLVKILQRTGYIENLAQGIQRIKTSYKDYDIKNFFNIGDDYFKISLPNLNPIQNVSNNVSNNCQ